VSTEPTSTDPETWPAAGILRLLEALENPLAFERQEAWANMNEVLADHRAGKASYGQYLEAWDAYEQAAKAERGAQS
jgi:hypothetical protein